MTGIETTLLRQALLLIGVAVVMLSGPAIGGGVLIWRKQKARASRRSPLTTKLLRGPGQTLRDHIEESRVDLMADLAMMMTMPLMLVGLHLAQSYLLGAPESTFRIGFTTVAAIGMTLWSARRLYKRSRSLDFARLGLDAEIAVGQELDQLMREGAAVFHDFPAEGFNIDHVVISPSGIYAIETKGYSKPNRSRGAENAKVGFDGHALHFPNWTTTKPLEQAERQAAWLKKWLSNAVGTSVSVTPVLALPGWFVERAGRGSVWVFSGKEIRKLLSQRSAPAVDAQLVRQAAHQVEQRCRNVSPTYRPLDQGG
ncbi:nuclease-related domain-containing protein [Denitromonas halophila]|uniref:NERD domain-containing protein n=1 Tax=Denitromonas halophila TaxID=1629404 RepID=A0A557R0C2_9RHOO|nr:nuclease-related domain-containing protein [Denitromonas halophila]TVO58603.1 NERD domain-containing protein [Denitromonas halophila]